MNIYVGNIPYGLDVEEVTQLFTEYGEVRAIKIIKDKFSGKSKGYGFVKLNNNGSGLKAVEGLNGKEIKGRSLRVLKAHNQDIKYTSPETKD